ncbi:hypothetical protein JCM8097_001546 [Rhodosporidiobolus ruineniae]
MPPRTIRELLDLPPELLEEIAIIAAADEEFSGLYAYEGFSRACKATRAACVGVLFRTPRDVNDGVVQIEIDRAKQALQPVLRRIRALTLDGFSTVEHLVWVVEQAVDAQELTLEGLWPKFWTTPAKVQRRHGRADNNHDLNPTTALLQALSSLSLLHSLHIMRSAAPLAETFVSAAPDSLPRLTSLSCVERKLETHVLQLIALYSDTLESLNVRISTSVDNSALPLFSKPMRRLTRLEVKLASSTFARIDFSLTPNLRIFTIRAMWEDWYSSNNNLALFLSPISRLSVFRLVTKGSNDPLLSGPPVDALTSFCASRHSRLESNALPSRWHALRDQIVNLRDLAELVLLQSERKRSLRLCDELSEALEPLARLRERMTARREPLPPLSDLHRYNPEYNGD